MPSQSITAIPSDRITIAPATSGGGKTNVHSFLVVVAVLAGLALLAGLVGLYLTRDRSLPVPAGDAPPVVPVDPPAGGYPTPNPDPDHDWGTQTPGPPPPPPPPPGPYEDEP